MTPIRVLLADDQALVRTGFRMVVAAQPDMEAVGEAADGAEALEAAAQLRPDVVLLDVRLPDTDGFEIAARLALSGDSPTVVLTSSRDAADFGDLVARSGARGFIPKAELSGPALAELLD